MKEFLEGLKNTPFKFDVNDPQTKPMGKNIHLGHPFPHSNDSKILMSLAKKGKPKTPEHKEKVRLKRIGTKQTEYQKQRARESLEAAWVVTTPSGQVMNIVNMRKFAEEHNLDQGNMVKVSQGILKQHKGYTCYKVT